MDKCLFCNKLANFQCQRCRDFYCSRECQVSDWQAHKYICITMPSLIKSNKCNQKHGSQEFLNAGIDKKIVRRYPDAHIQPLRLPHGLIENVKVRQNMTTKEYRNSKNDDFEVNFIENNFNYLAINQEITHKDAGSLTSINCNPLQKAISSGVEIVGGIRNEESKINSELNMEVQSFELEKKSCQLVKSNMPEGEKNPKLWKCLRELPKGSFNAIVQCIDNEKDIVWISAETWIEDSEKLLYETNRDINTMKNYSKESLSYGDLVIVPFEEIYYRAIVTEEINPLKEVRVRLIDYGNDFMIQYSQCKIVNTNNKSHRAMAFPIKYSRNIEIGQTICIKIDKKDNDIYIVEEMNEHKNAINDNVLSKVKTSFNMKIFHKLNANQNKAFGLVVQENQITESLLANLSDILKNSPTPEELDSNFEKGTYVAAQCEMKKWRRVLVLENFKNYYLVLFIDVGMIRVVNKIKKLPKEYLMIPSPIVALEFNKIINKKEYISCADNSTIFSCKSKENGSDSESLVCTIYFDKIELGNAVLKNFDGNYLNFLDNDIYTYPFNSGDVVHINIVIDYSNVNIGLTGPTKYYKTIFNEIGNWSKTLEKNFTIGQTVLAQNKNKEYFRGRIVSVSDNAHFEVIDLDSNLIYDVAPETIKEAIDFVKLCPLVTREVQLFILNMVKIHDSNKRVNILEEFCKNEKTFTIEWESDCAELFYFEDEDKKSLNKYIISQLYKSNETKDESRKIDEPKEQNLETEDETRKIDEPKEQNLETKDESRKIDEPKEQNLDDISKKSTDNKIITRNEETIYKLNDVKVIPLNVGENIRLIILDTSDLQNGVFTASIDDLVYYSKLIQEDQPAIIEHCNKDNIEKEYFPKVGELCFTHFDEDSQWYRAFCIDVKDNNKFDLMFLDFGNVQTTSSTKIRKMDKKFLFPCYANTCILKGLSYPISDETLKNLNQILKPNSLIKFDKIEKLQEQEYLTVIEGVEKI